VVVIEANTDYDGRERAPKGPFDVAAFDSDGKLLNVLQYPYPMDRRHRRHSAHT
jgi:hypothetical protein